GSRLTAEIYKHFNEFKVPAPDPSLDSTLLTVMARKTARIDQVRQKIAQEEAQLLREAKNLGEHLLAGRRLENVSSKAQAKPAPQIPAAPQAEADLLPSAATAQRFAESLP